jgi:hypothetical protein
MEASHHPRLIALTLRLTLTIDYGITYQTLTNGVDDPRTDYDFTAQEALELADKLIREDSERRERGQKGDEHDPTDTV